MTYISLLLPSIKCSNATYEEISETIYRTLGFKSSDIEIFRLVPLSSDDNLNKIPSVDNIDPYEIAVRVHSINLNLREIEQIIKERDNIKIQFVKTNEALKTYLTELQRMRKYFSLISQNEEEDSKTKYF